ncbi:hypothetical protein [Streptomyces enissocaesilis]|uniref:Uncharacterized protein n=1 Tax=Streptomyces enissocaesilis TaxID=332589 RepID=A0ABN3XAS4_9ACTN
MGWFDNLGTAPMRDHTEPAERPGWAAVQYLVADTTDHENRFLENAPVSPGPATWSSRPLWTACPTRTPVRHWGPSTSS